MNDAPDRTLRKLRVDGRLLADLVEIMSRNGRRAVVKLDDLRVESPAELTAAEVDAAGEVDVSSFWVNPERPDHGRRHFVYFLAGPTGAKYFGDSISPEVTLVCEDLDRYFGRHAAGSSDAVAGSSAWPTWWPTKGWPFWLLATRDRFIAALCLAGFLIAVVAFLVGRWTAPEKVLYTQPTTDLAPMQPTPSGEPLIQEPTNAPTTLPSGQLEQRGF